MRITSAEQANEEMRLFVNQLSMQGYRCEQRSASLGRIYTELDVEPGGRVFIQIDLDRISGKDWGYQINLLGRDQTNGIAFENLLATVMLRQLAIDCVASWHRIYAQDQMNLLRQEEEFEEGS